ncbi:MAG TPA: acyl carrier protein [Jatrophihabitans sp.]|nr:acyl carrier protein [Jatrophihabitans sp.]
MSLDDLVLQRCRDVVEDTTLDWDGDLYDAGLDSIGLLELSAILSADAGVDVTISDLFDCATPGAVARFLHRRASAPSTS